MDVTLKPIDQQVIVITGASSGIGLATAMAAAERGAALVLVARSQHTLDAIVQQLTTQGRQVIAVAARRGRSPGDGSRGERRVGALRSHRHLDQRRRCLDLWTAGRGEHR